MDLRKCRVRVKDSVSRAGLYRLHRVKDSSGLLRCRHGRVLDDKEDSMVKAMQGYEELQRLLSDYKTVTERCPYEVFSDKGEAWIKSESEKLDKEIKSCRRKLRALYDELGIEYNGSYKPIGKADRD